jgi:hypothetical protein
MCRCERDVNTRPGRTAARQPGGRFCTTTRSPLATGSHRGNRGRFPPRTRLPLNSPTRCRDRGRPSVGSGAPGWRGVARPNDVLFPAALRDLQEARCETAEGRFRSSSSTFRDLHWTLDPAGATSPVGLTPLLGGRCELEEPVRFLSVQRPLSHLVHTHESSTEL